MKTNFRGKKPFVYISFIAADRSGIGELLSAFDKIGIYYAYADRPNDNTASMIRRCSVFVTVMSAAALRDERFIAEITSAKNAEKTAVAAVSERDLEIPGFIQLQVNRFQNIFLYRHDENTSLEDEIRRANVFVGCTKRRFVTRRITVSCAIILASAIIGTSAYFICKSSAEPPVEPAGISTTDLSEHQFSATNGLQYSVEGDTVSIIGYYGTETTVTVPETYRNHPVTKIASSAFRDTAVTSVILPPCVTMIEDEAFYNCTYLEHVYSYGRDVSVSDLAFIHCKVKELEYKERNMP